MTQNTPSPFIPAAHINKSVMIRRKKHEDICLYIAYLVELMCIFGFCEGLK